MDSLFRLCKLFNLLKINKQANFKLSSWLLEESSVNNRLKRFSSAMRSFSMSRVGLRVGLGSEVVELVAEDILVE